MFRLLVKINYAILFNCFESD